MMRRDAQRTLHAQRGAAGLLAAVFLMVVVLFMGQVTLRLASTSVNDSLLTHDGVGALLLAESGLERAAGQLADGTATCDATLAGSWSYAGGTFTIADLGAGFNTDFDGSALAAGQCRVRATGSTGLFTAQRTVEAIIGTDTGNLLTPNADFNLPGGICWFFCTPTGWSFTSNAWGGWDDNGGPDGTRAAQIRKPFAGSVQTTVANLTSLTPFTVTAPTTLTVNYDYRVISSGQNVQLQIRLASGLTFYTASVTYGPSAGFQSGSLAINITGSGPVTIDGFRLTLTASAGQPKTLLVDNLVLSGGGSTAGIERWREIIQ